MRKRNEFAWIKYFLRIERLFYTTHQPERYWITQPVQFIPLHLAYAMLGADGSAEPGDQIMNIRAYDFSIALFPLSAFGVFGCNYMEMYVAITQMAESNRRRAGEPLFDLRRCRFHEFRHPRYWDGNIVLHGWTYCSLRGRDTFAQQPECFSLGLAR